MALNDWSGVQLSNTKGPVPTGWSTPLLADSIIDGAMMNDDPPVRKLLGKAAHGCVVLTCTWWSLTTVTALNMGLSARPDSGPLM